MVRSRMTIVGLVLVVVVVLAVKAVRGPQATARGNAAEVLTGADLAASLSNGKPTLVDFGEGWCEQCKKQAPVLEATAKKYRGKANVVFVDTKDYAEIGRAYGIVAIPTQIFFDTQGREVSRHVGYYPPEEIAKDLAKVGAK